MKLLLTSAGLSTKSLEDTFLNLLNKPPNENRAIIMGVDPGISDFDMDAYIEKNVHMLIKQGLLEKNIDIYKLDDDNPLPLEDNDVLWMLGGNSYRHMYHIKKQGIEQRIRDYVMNEGLYVGRSAGAIIMGPTVDIESCFGFPNDIGLVDTSGFGYVDFITAPHVDTMSKRIPQVADFHKNTGHKIVYLTDQQGILVIDDMYKIV